MRKLILLTALALLGVLCAASAAPAKSRDHNHDRIPDRWERSHHLSLKVSQARRDQDRDGLNNRGEYRAKTDPRDADSDDDGVRDGSEHAGTITSFQGNVLTIALAGGGELAATVDAGTEIECHSSARKSSGENSGPGGDEDESRGDDDPADHDTGDDHGDDDAQDVGDDHGDDTDDDDEHGDTEDGDDVNDHGDDDDRCGSESLTVGTRVREAELKVTAAGKRWSELELTK